ncbi:MAG: glycosyltransferase family 4 protein [Polyangiaceae bacterium]
MTRIAVLTTSYPAHEGDGAGHFVASEVRALEAAGCTVHVFVPRGAAFGWPGILPRLRARPGRAVSLPRALWTTRAAFRRGEPYDRVIAHWMPTALLARGSRAPLTVVVHGSDVTLLESLPAPLARPVATLLLSRADRIEVVSEALRARLARFFAAGAPMADRTFVVAPRIEVEADRAKREAATLRTSLGLGDRRLGVVVARLIASKRVDRVIARVADSSPRPVLVVVGDGPERARLVAFARERGVDARFVGQVPRDVALAFIAAADVVMHASEREGLSTVLREAEALGTPVDAVL